MYMIFKTICDGNTDHVFFCVPYQVLEYYVLLNVSLHLSNTEYSSCYQFVQGFHFQF